MSAHTEDHIDHEIADAPANAERRTLLQKSLLAGGAIIGAGLAVPVPNASAALSDMVRRVVSANNAEGKSYIAKDEMVKRDTMWTTHAGEALGPITAGDKSTPLPPISVKNLPDGGTQAYFFSIAPSVGPFDRASIQGWHRDESIVYIFLVSGTMRYVNEVNDTVISAGDVLIQRNANHTWHNAGKEPATAFAVKIRVV